MSLESFQELSLKLENRRQEAVVEISMVETALTNVTADQPQYQQLMLRLQEAQDSLVEVLARQQEINELLANWQYPDPTPEPSQPVV